MAANPIYLAGTFLFEGGGIAWAAWEIWKLRPKTDGAKEETSAFARTHQDAASPEGARHPEGEHGPDHG